jgi:hypothetical protein
VQAYFVICERIRAVGSVHRWFGEEHFAVKTEGLQSGSRAPLRNEDSVVEAKLSCRRHLPRPSHFPVAHCIHTSCEYLGNLLQDVTLYHEQQSGLKLPILERFRVLPRPERNELDNISVSQIFLPCPSVVGDRLVIAQQLLDMHGVNIEAFGELLVGLLVHR